MTGPYLNEAPADLTSADDVLPQRDPGTCYADPITGKEFMYAKVTIGGTNANTLIAGRPVYDDVRASCTFLTDNAGTEKTLAGVLTYTRTSGRFGWYQRRRVGTEFAGLVTSGATANSNLIADSANGCLKVVDTTSAATALGAGIQIVATNKAAGSNPATPATTLCEFV